MKRYIISPATILSFLLGAILMGSHFVYSQSVTSLDNGNLGQYKSGGIILNTGGARNGLLVDHGYVGIGTNNPVSIFDVEGLGNVIFNTSGNVGIGTRSPGQKLDVAGNIKANGIIESTLGGFKF